MLLLASYFRWWELTLKTPALLIWTVIFLVLFLGTAAFVLGTRIRNPRHPSWKRVFVWLGIVIVTLVAILAIPQVRIGDVPVSTVAFAGILDVVLPGWIFVSAITLLWKGPVSYAILALVPVLLLVGIWAFVIRMPGSSHQGPLAPLSAEQHALRSELEKHVRILSVEIGERSDGKYAATQRAAGYIDSALTAIGFEVTSQLFDFAGEEYRNLEVMIPGTIRADEIVVVGAHYDTAEDAPGADDNASGVAGTLELARLLAHEQLERTVKFVLFASEEPPFFATEWMGSYAYAARAAARRENIVAMLSLETIGYYSTEPGSQSYPPPFSFFYPDQGDFIGFVGNMSSGNLVRRCLATFRRHARFPSEGVASPTWIPGVTWSDHLPFWQHGFKAIMVTNTAPFRNPFYHTQHDTIDKLDFDRMSRVVAGLVGVVRELASEG
jgi:hypothetical protein